MYLERERAVLDARRPPRTCRRWHLAAPYSDDIGKVDTQGAPTWSPCHSAPYPGPFRPPFRASCSSSDTPEPSHIRTTGGPERTGNNPKPPGAEAPATVGFRPVFPGQRAPQKRVVLGLITRRSRVQIPPPLPPENPGAAWVFCRIVKPPAGPGRGPLMPN